MKYYIVTDDLQGGEFGMERAYTAKEWGEQAYEWAYGDGDEDAESWLSYKSDQELIDGIADVWDLAFAEINEEQKEVYENLLKEIDIAETNFYSAELKHNVDDQKFYQEKAFELRRKLNTFYEEVQSEE